MSIIQNNEELKQKIGGQAVIEGVMMRSPNSYAVAVRKADGQLVIKEQAWQSIWTRMKFFRWPFFRGSVVLVESLWNGLSALTFSANQAFDEEEEEKKKKKKKKRDSKKEDGEAVKGEEKVETGDNKNVEAKNNKDDNAVLGPLALIGTIAVSFAFALGLFVVIPHALTALMGLNVENLSFHAVDGVIKVIFFVGYVWAISFIKDIKRVFQYHGAEHMSIFAFGDGKDLTVENVRPYGTFHPRCGTSFIMVVLLISIILFSIIFPFLPALPEMHKILRHLIYVAIKIPLMLPIAGISYELIKFAGKNQDNKILKLAVLPGLWLQKITTSKPDDSQLEIAILSLRKCLWREKNLDADGMETIHYYPDFETAVKAIENGGAIVSDTE